MTRLNATARTSPIRVEDPGGLVAKLGHDDSGLIAAGSNRPFLLDDPQKVWIVCAGNVDVFAVRMQHGVPVGERRHVFRAEPGQMLVGMNLSSYRREIGLLAVGAAATRLLPIERAQLEALAFQAEAIDDLVTLVNAWVNGLSEGLARNRPSPRQYQLLESEIESVLEPQQVARPRRGILWVSAVRGIARFMGWEELPLMGEDDFLPLSEYTWVEAVGQTALYGLETRAFLLQPIAWGCLENFHRMVLDLIIWNVEREGRAERERLRQRGEFDHAYLQNAFTYLSSILTPWRAVPLMADGLQDPLLTACRMVGGAIGMPIRPRPDPVDGQPEPQTLDSITTASRVRTRQVALRGQWWEADNGPLLAYMEADNRPVALLPVSPSRYELHDPTEKTQTPVSPAVAAALSPFAYSFYRSFPEQKMRAGDVLRFGLFGARRDLLTVLVMGVLGGLLGIIPPLVTGYLFDVVIPNAERVLLWELAAILVVSALTAALFQITRSIAVLRLESRLEATTQSAVWDRLLKLPVPFFRDYTAGDLTNRAMGVTHIRQVISGSLALSILSGIFSVFNFALLFFINGQLALLASLLVLIAGAATVIAGILQSRYYREVVNLQGKISGLVLQIITGITKLRIAGVEGRVFAYWSKEYGEQRILTFKTRQIANGLMVFSSAYTVIAPLAIFAVVAGGGDIPLSTGSFIAFLVAFNGFLLAGLQLSSALVSVLRIVPLYERAQPILHTLPEVTASKADPGPLLGEIEVSHITFRYKEKGPVVMDDVSFHIQRGEFVALVGPSGSGKSTLVRLLLGFESPEAGAIFYDGQNLNGLDLRAVRQQVGVVLQNSQLMTGDLYTNIAGASRLSMDDAWEAARRAGLAEDIEQMPMGMHTFVSAGAGATTLSGGQRQRVLIARAIAKKPRILVFDEATSALDNQTQAVVSQSLEQLDATRIVIAHRLTTIQHADRILVMEKGRIVQEGAFADLMTQADGLFAELVRRQLA